MIDIYLIAEMALIAVMASILLFIVSYGCFKDRRGKKQAEEKYIKKPHAKRKPLKGRKRKQ